MVQFEQFPVIRLSKLQDELRFEFPNLPQQLFDYYLVKTAIIMAKEGHLIRRRVLIDTICNVSNYELSVPDNLVVLGILSAHTGKCTCGQNIRRTFVPSGDCKQNIWYDDIEKELIIDGCSGQVELILSVGPTKDACELPSEYYDLYLDTLTMGTRAAIMLITNRPWSNIKLGAALEQEFRSMLAHNAIDASTHKMRGAIHMNFGRGL